ncbi:hypothetical protein F2Q70_00025414 [Brassica cretica]|uniref:Uncharacterized protein n=1 Tax=Brassica cretica TaxID=69181 RepID=A0A8S9L535_BRACR|nr:hypothetical protein F2Q70_00025414 [Brassica cretica]
MASGAKIGRTKKRNGSTQEEEWVMCTLRATVRISLAIHRPYIIRRSTIHPVSQKRKNGRDMIQIM